MAARRGAGGDTCHRDQACRLLATLRIMRANVTDQLGAEDPAMKAFALAPSVRTWAGTVLAARTLQRVEPASRRAVNAAVRRVAAHLGNTPAICRKCYVRPGVIGGFLEGSLGRIAASIPRRASSAAGERMVMRLLERVRRSSAAT